MPAPPHAERSVARRGAPQEDRAPAAPPIKRRTARFVVAAAITLIALWVARDFLLALAWAIVIAVAAWPAYRRFLRVLPERGYRVLTPLLFTLLIGLLVMVPLGFAAVEVTRDGLAAVAWLTEVQQHGIPAPGWLAQLPLVGHPPPRGGRRIWAIRRAQARCWTRSTSARQRTGCGPSALSSQIARSSSW